MFPWNYGFRWGPGTAIFLGAFYTVLAIVATTVLIAAWRARRDVRKQAVEHIRWRSDFHDLTPEDKVCRHVLTGEFETRECPNAFDCRKCEMHAKILAKRPTEPLSDADGNAFGLAFPADRYYHRGHTWAHPEADGTMTIGIDDLGRRLIGAPDRVDVPKPGVRVHANGTVFRIRKRDTAVRMPCPVDGEVVETGGPDRAWYLRVKPDAPDVRHLLHGAEIQPWILREIERLQLALAREGATAPSLADGGVLVNDVSENYPDADWEAVCGEMFLQS